MNELANNIIEGIALLAMVCVIAWVLEIVVNHLKEDSSKKYVRNTNLEYVTEETGKAIIAACASNEWSADGKYVFQDSERNVWVGVHTCDMGIFEEEFHCIDCCEQWLMGLISIKKLKADSEGVYECSGLTGIDIEETELNERGKL